MRQWPSFTPSIWFTLTPDGKVTMHIVKAEMGQHIGTALAQVIAEELEVDWQDVRLDTPLESVENFAIYGLASTANSGSVTTEFDRLSRAGAAGRMALDRGRRQAARRRSGSDATPKRAASSTRRSGRSIGYGEIIRKVRIDRKFAYPDDFRTIKIKEAGQLQDSSASRSRRSTFRRRRTARRNTASTCSCRTCSMARSCCRARAMPPTC